MKSAIVNQYGPPEIITIKQIPKPVPNDHQVLVKVIATTVNRTDCATLRAHPFFMRIITGLIKPKKQILGTEFAGQIVAIGKQVTKFKNKDLVFGFDDTGVQSHAEYLTISENKGVNTIPSQTKINQVIGSLEGTHYAFNFINKVPLQKGDQVLVNGASGAIGSTMIQLLKYYQAKITAVTETKNIKLVKSLGAEKTIDYQKTNFTQITNQQFDYIFDTVGKSSFHKCKHLLKPQGIYISSELGPHAENVYLPLITKLLGNKKTVFPFPSDINRTINLAKKLIKQDKLKPVIDKTYPLDKIVQAFKYVETGQKTGNVIIKVAKL